MEGLLSFPVLGPPSFGAAIVFYFGHEAEIAHYKRQCRTTGWEITGGDRRLTCGPLLNKHETEEGFGVEGSRVAK